MAKHDWHTETIYIKIILNTFLFRNFFQENTNQILALELKCNTVETTHEE